MSHKVGQYPTVQKYNRIPTRMKVQLFWGIMAFGVFYWQMMKLTVWRINPKRNEQLFLEMQERLDNGQKLPEFVYRDAVAQREMRDTLTLHVSRDSTPNPGEMTGAMQKDFDARRMSLKASHVQKQRME